MSPKDTLSRVKEGIEGLLPDSLKSASPYVAVVNPKGRLVVNVNGFDIGYIVDAPFFEAKWFHPAEIEILARFEEYTQGILKDSKPRTYSGLHPYSHIYRVAGTAFKIAKEADAPLDFETLLLIAGHDSIEDRRRIKELLEQWDTILITKTINYEKIRVISEELQIERKLARDEIRDRLLEYMAKTGAKGNLREGLRRRIIPTTDCILDVTRFPDQYPYALSMARQYKRVGPESLDRVLRRAIMKNADRSSNLEEYHPLPANDMRGIVRAFEDDQYFVDGHVVGQELKERYGAVSGSATEMPAAIKVGTSFNSLFSLQFQNETLNHPESRTTANARTQELLKLIKYSKAYMIQATLGLLDSAISAYESDRSMPRGLKATVTDEIKGKQSDRFYYEITLDGFVRNWIIYDALGSKFIEELGKQSGKKVEIYRSARDIRVVTPMFDMFSERDKRDDIGRPILITDPNVRYNPRIHDYFTLDGVDETLKSVRGNKFREMVTRQMRQYQQELHGQQETKSNLTFRFF